MTAIRWRRWRNPLPTLPRMRGRIGRGHARNCHENHCHGWGGLYRVGGGSAPPGKHRSRGVRHRQADLCRQPRLARSRARPSPLPLQRRGHLRPGRHGTHLCGLCARCRDASCRRKPCRSFDRRPGRFHQHQCGRHLCAARGLACALAAARRDGRWLPLSSHLDRRSVRRADRRRPLHRGDALRSALALFGHQGCVRPPGAGMGAHLRAACARHELLEQLRAAPVSGKAHPLDHHQGPRRRGDAGLRDRAERARLAVRRRSCERAHAGAGTRPCGRDLQYRRQCRAVQYRCGPRDLRCARPGVRGRRLGASQARDFRCRPARPRLPLRDRFFEAQRRIGVVAATQFRPGPCRDGRLVHGKPRLVGTAARPARHRRAPRTHPQAGVSARIRSRRRQQSLETIIDRVTINRGIA